jgi:S1-C subfamily serine protease
VVYRNEERDFSLLLVNAPANDFLTGAEFDDVLCPPVGTAVIHCGNWLGADFDGSVSEGIISQTGVQPAIENWHWKITDQISATVVPGSSGGPIFRRDNGKCVGIVVGGVGRGALGFASYIPTRVIASEEIIRWAVFGNWCPPDELLEKMIVLAGPVEVINPYE